MLKLVFLATKDFNNYMSQSQALEHCTCGITVEELVTSFSPDEGVGSQFDLAADFADDETYAVYVTHHEEAKIACQALQTLVNQITDLRDQVAQI